MQGHAGDAGMFIRSMATRGFLGGLARATAEVALLLDAAGKDQVLIETVGVGQDEIDIVRLADCVVVVLVPGLGDDIQNMKAGLMEIGDIFVVNKSDREGADRLEQELHAMLSLVMPRDGWHPPVVRTVAGEGKGIDALAATIGKFRAHFESSGERRKKHVEHWKARLIELVESRLLQRALGGAGGEARLTALAAEVADRKRIRFRRRRKFSSGAGCAFDRPGGARPAPRKSVSRKVQWQRRRRKKWWLARQRQGHRPWPRLEFLAGAGCTRWAD